MTTLSQVPESFSPQKTSTQHLVPPFEYTQGISLTSLNSYAHADGEVVFREIQRLHESGYRIWYDEGIEPGNDWPWHIAQAGQLLTLSDLYFSLLGSIGKLPGMKSNLH